MDKGLEQFIDARRAEGHRYVIIDVDAGCIGWGVSIDEAWQLAAATHPERLGDAECYDAARTASPVESRQQYTARSAKGKGDL